MYYLGVDGGGTKTLFTLYDESGNVLASCKKESCHYAQVGYDGIKEIIREGAKQVRKKCARDIAAKDVFVCLGLAGYGQEQKVREKIEEAVAKALKNYRDWYLTNDIEIAFRASLNNQNGILVIAGTGSVVMAKTGDKILRCGGWGPAAGDEGSAYWIGRKILASFTKQADGREAKSDLYDLVKEELKLKEDADIVSFAQFSRKHHREAIAMLAKIGAEAAQKKDPTALKILDEAAKELALMVNTLAGQFNENKVLASYAGGVFQAGDVLLASFIRYLDHKVLLAGPCHAPVYGAYLLAKEMTS